MKIRHWGTWRKIDWVYTMIIVLILGVYAVPILGCSIYY